MLLGGSLAWCVSGNYQIISLALAASGLTGFHLARTCRCLADPHNKRLPFSLLSLFLRSVSQACHSTSANIPRPELVQTSAGDQFVVVLHVHHSLSTARRRPDHLSDLPPDDNHSEPQRGDV